MLEQFRRAVSRRDLSDLRQQPLYEQIYCGLPRPGTEENIFLRSANHLRFEAEIFALHARASLFYGQRPFYGIGRLISPDVVPGGLVLVPPQITYYKSGPGSGHYKLNRRRGIKTIFSVTPGSVCFPAYDLFGGNFSQADEPEIHDPKVCWLSNGYYCEVEIRNLRCLSPQASAHARMSFFSAAQAHINNRRTSS